MGLPRAEDRYNTHRIRDWSLVSYAIRMVKPPSAVKVSPVM